MVRLHVLDHQIVRRTSVKSPLEIGQPALSFARIRRIENGDPVVEYHIGIVGHAVRHRILAFEEIESGVISAYVAHRIVDSSKHIQTVCVLSDI